MIIRSLLLVCYSGKRYDLRSDEVASIYNSMKEFREQPVRQFIPIFIPVLKKILPKSIRNFLFKEHIFDAFINDMRLLVEVSPRVIFITHLRTRLPYLNDINTLVIKIWNYFEFND